MALTWDKVKAANPGLAFYTTSDGMFCHLGAWRFVAHSPAEAQEKIWQREPHRRPVRA